MNILTLNTLDEANNVVDSHDLHSLEDWIKHLATMNTEDCIGIEHEILWDIRAKAQEFAKLLKSE